MRFAVFGAALLALLLGSPEVGQAHERSEPWTVRQAESVTTIRSMRVHVLECHGLGSGVTRAGTPRYRHFRCYAGTRAPWERYDTIAVLYVLHPLRGNARFAVTDVRFIGGPGIP